MDAPGPLDPQAELFFKALASEATEARCQACGISEWIVPLDGDLDADFLTHYHCNECDGLEPKDIAKPEAEVYQDES